jgi:hypothetical protein
MSLLAIITFFMVNIETTAQQQEDYRKYYLKLNVYGGADWLMRTKTSPYNNKISNGFTVGASTDKYWNKIGVGLDFAYAENQAQRYDETGLIADLTSFGNVLNYTSSGTIMQRMILTLGPTFRQDMFKKKILLEIAAHGGYARVNGGALVADINPPVFGNYNVYNDLGYAPKTYLPIAKGTVRLNYFIKPNFGIFAQGQYMKYFESMQTVVFLNRQTLKKERSDYEINVISATLGLTYTSGRYKGSEVVMKKDKKTADKMIQKAVKVTVLDHQANRRTEFKVIR